MRSQIRLWNVKSGELKQLQQDSFSKYHKEKDLEEWVEKEPSLLGRGLTVIGRQLDIPNAGCLDLLAIDDDGRLVVIEFKRHTTTREAIAQILDYSSSIRLLTLDQLKAIPSIKTEKLLEVTDFDPAMILVAADAEERAERIVDYLASKAKLSIEVVSFTYVTLIDGGEILARSILVPDEPILAKSAAVQMKLPELVNVAAERGVGLFVDVFRTVSGLGWWEETLPNFGGTLRYWVLMPSGKSQVLFGMYIGGGKLDSPKGQLDLWFNPDTAADFAGSTAEITWEELERFTVVKKTATQVFLRIADETTAKELYSLLGKWNLANISMNAEASAK